ncbi:conserved hypothetical protein [Nitrospina gracilis 3/211]|uniref:Uncharacterized protein n=1 Tax=Nitrospina gracilis (strain 3/211) TaxID=1266370 RepID=M1Z0J8_NITG3|nr:MULTISPECIES: hypothetical protein [Nitrospina]MCF8723924.1 hypothetical protein [Nitrospina sp. Nb-3]CCQ91047.1 conserved hypothetical protein [Nitrospina gracilis 3/211]
MTKDNPVSLPTDSQANPTPLWQFVRPDEYKVPVTAVASTALRKWTAFKQLFIKNGENGDSPFKAEVELKTLPEVRLRHLVPPIDWNEVAGALDAELEGWLDECSLEVPVQFVVFQPHCGQEDLLRHWADLHDALLLESPTPEQILKADPHWLGGWPNTDRVWVLPHLEHCFLRHANGLELVRRFLEWAASGRLGRGLIGCDSWGWAYLQRVGPRSQWSPLTLQAFDGARLSRLFSRKKDTGDRNDRVRFLNAKTGKTILSWLEDEGGASSELNQLAGRCRGNFGTALIYWSQRLRAEPDEEDTAAVEEESDRNASQRTKEESVWVAELPDDMTLPVEKDESVAFVLHSLLLHNGLTEELLSKLLSIPDFRIASLLRRLQASGAVVEEAGRWEVTAQGYSAVREYLSARDYLLDGF